MKNNSGFTIIELLVSIIVTMVIAIGLFDMILTTKDIQITESKKLNIDQEGRAFEQILCDQLKSSGSIISMFNNSELLDDSTFNGVYPLNNTTYSDGVILVSGDPKGVTTLTSDFLTSVSSLNVSTTLKVDGSSAWQIGDFGIVARNDGYYVFAVTGVGVTSLNISSDPVYFSGLLNTTNYADSANAGTGLYPTDSPVVRLDYFSTLLVMSETDGSRTLVQVSDFGGAANGDILNVTPYVSTGGFRRIGPFKIISNIFDFQLLYLDDSGTAISAANVLSDFLDKGVGSVRVSALFRTIEEKNKLSNTGVHFVKPQMGDIPESTLPIGRYHYHFMQFDISLRNYNI